MYLDGEWVKHTCSFLCMVMNGRCRRRRQRDGEKQARKLVFEVAERRQWCGGQRVGLFGRRLSCSVLIVCRRAKCGKHETPPIDRGWYALFVLDFHTNFLF